MSLQYVVRSTLALLGIGFAALLFVVLATVWLSERAQHHIDDVTAARELRSSATVLRESLLTGESSQRGYLLTQNEIYLAPYDTARASALGELARLDRLLASRPDRQMLLAQLTQVVSEKIKEQDTSIALKTANRDAETAALINSNRGKALMDEANVYLSALMLESEDRLTAGVADQASNTTWLRWTSAVSALVIMVVVSGVISTFHRYTREILVARDEVRRTNETLELRVAQRTEELMRARDRAEVLLAEVNHRVANSLALVSSLVRLQARELREPSAKQALEETNARILAIAQMHKHLFTTDCVGDVAADKYLHAVLDQLETTIAAVGSNIRLRRDLASVTVATTDAVNLGVITVEWVTNALKYAYPDGQGEVRVRLQQSAEAYEVAVEDDGVGRDEAEPPRGTGWGTRVVSTIAKLMEAEVRYYKRNPGTAAYLSMTRRPAYRTAALDGYAS